MPLRSMLSATKFFLVQTVRCLYAAAALSPAALYAATDEIFTDEFEQTIAYNVSFTENTVISGTTLLANANVPAGSYAAFVRLQVITDSTKPSTSFRLDCSLSPDFDFGDYRLGTDTSAERYVTFQGAVTLSTAHPIQFSCYDANGHQETVLSGQLTIMSVGSVN